MTSNRKYSDDHFKIKSEREKEKITKKTPVGTKPRIK